MTARVRRDLHGIPFLSAGDPLALAHLQGRVTALDRSWQLELDRRRGEGRSAEWLGPAAVGWDVFARRIRLADTARRCLAGLDDEHRQWVSAYAAGVTEGLADARSHEFGVLGVRPQEWRPWHPILALLVQHVFGSGFPAKLWRAQVADRLGVEALDWFGAGEPPTGSNAWAVTGARTATGTPLLAADPHRLLEWPGCYQQIGLRCPEFDVIGLAFPGVPGVPHFGHTGHVAWAITSAVADDRDLYAETIHRDGARWWARGPDGPEPVATHTEEVTVRDGANVVVTVAETARGPLLDPDAERPLSLRTPVRVLGDCGLNASLPLLRAQDAAAAAAAWRHWVEPVNRVLIADRHRVVELTAGRVPIRDLAAARLTPAATDPAAAWRGWRVGAAREVADVAVHANQPAADDEPLTADPAPSERAARIAALLRPPGPVTGEDCRRIQGDTFSAAAGTLLDLLRTARPREPAAEPIRRTLLSWDRRMTASSVAAGWFARWRHALVEEVLAEPALAPLDGLPPTDPLLAPWCSTRAWAGLSLVRLLGSPAVRDAVDVAGRALDRIARTAPRSWGDTHRLAPWHGLDGTADPVLVAARARLTAPVDGDTETVLATTTLPGVSDECVRVPVARVVWDLGDRARSRWIVPLGAAGDPTGPHAFDQFAAWLAGDLAPCTDRPEGGDP